MTEERMRADAARNRDRLVQAARELFAERGLDATLNDVARRAGVGVGTAYRRFADKHQLIDAILDEQDAELERIAQDALAEPDAWQALITYLDRSTSLHARDRGMAQILSGRHVRKERHDLSRDRLAHLVEEIVGRAKASGELRSDIAATDLILLQIAAVAVAQSTVGHEIPDAGRFADVYQRLLGIAIDGLRATRENLTPLSPPALSTDDLHVLLRPADVDPVAERRT